MDLRREHSRDRAKVRVRKKSQPEARRNEAQGFFPLRRFGVLLLLLLPLLAVAGCHRGNIHQTLRKNIGSPPSPTVLAVYEPWFGDRDHIDVGYSSQDPVVLRDQVRKARDLGISAFVVDWYGKRKSFLDGAYARLQQVAVENQFKVILMYDEPEGLPHQATDYALASLEYAYENYIGPEAPHRGAYFTYNGRPVLFVWPRHQGTDWARIRRYIDTWESSPILIMQDDYPQHSSVFDGYFAWVQPGKAGWQPDGSNRGLEYLEGYYSRMQNEYPDKIAVGAAWPGFDDHLASWGQGRYMDARCGGTFDDTLRMFRRYYDRDNPLEFLLIITWNDYEEGTAIEPGISRCAENPRSRRAATDN